MQKLTFFSVHVTINCNIRKEGIYYEKKIAEKYHADFLALQDMIILKAEKAGYESVTTDGIHLTEYGNEIIAGAWLQLFEKIKDGD